MRVALLLNPRAGTLIDRPELLGRIPAILREAGLDVTVITANAAPDLPGQLEAALALRPDVLVVGGGDGTIRSAAARLAGGSVALGVVPLGTLNLLARDLGMPMEPEAAAAALGQGVIRAIDVAEVNGEVFLCQSVIGLPNRMGLHRERVRGRGGLAARWRVVLGFARAWWRHPMLRLGLRMDDGPVLRVWTRAMSVVNNAYTEAPGQMFHRPRLDAGLLSLHVARDFDPWWLAKLLVAMAAGHWRKRPELLSGETETLAILSRNRHLRVMNDGEAMLLETPLRYSIRPRALRVLAPPEAVAIGAGPAEPLG
ncbi:MAG: Diacylglycerol kinase catalytic domain protein [Roseomonas sp.]|jgi:diacylglycerol kinase family enzyme|nr:Diacylglycerol kinase catalytic domain protein [Roseomonas sp.]